MRLLALAIAAAGCAGQSNLRASQSAPAPASFLERLAGDWTYEAEAVNGPGQPVTHLKGVEHGKLVGSWAVLETDGETPTGRFSGILTVGPQQGRYVGTWISSVQDTLVQYQGTLDEPAGTLTLDTTGPDPADPSRQVRYRDVLRVVDGDHKEVTSMAEVGGKWVTFLTSRYRRQR